MASGSQMEFDKLTILHKLTDIFDAIDNGSFHKIEKIFTSFSDDQRVTILNSTIQCWAPLPYAIKKVKVDIVQYLLEHSLRQGRETMCDYWRKHHHPLSVALELPNYKLIKMIARNMHDINEILPGCCTPLTKAIKSGDLQIVKLMLRLGADVNFPCLHGTSPLMESTSKIEICRYLIENNANLNQCDARGYGALHVAVEKGDADAVEILVDAGVDVHLVGKDGITPLLLSTVKLNMKIFRYLREIPTFTEMDKIDAKDAYNAFILLAGFSSLDYWYETLELRQDEYPKLLWVPDVDVLSSEIEFSTIAELDAIRHQPVKLGYQAILVLRRVFNRSQTIQFRSIIGAAVTTKEEGHLRELRGLLDYASSLVEKLGNMSCVLESTDFIKLLFDMVLVNRDENERIFFQKCALTLFEIVSDAIVEKWGTIKEDICNDRHLEDEYFEESVDLFLHMLNRIGDLEILEVKNRFDAVAEKVVEKDPRVDYHQSLLHRAIRFGREKDWNPAGLVEVLLKYGANPNSKDYLRHTPLMYALKHASDNELENIVYSLMDADCNFGYLSKEGYSAMDFSRWAALPNIPREPLDLDSLAIRVIVDNSIPYSGVLKKEIVDLIDSHL